MINASTAPTTPLSIQTDSVGWLEAAAGVQLDFYVLHAMRGGGRSLISREASARKRVDFALKFMRRDARVRFFFSSARAAASFLLSNNTAAL